MSEKAPGALRTRFTRPQIIRHIRQDVQFLALLLFMFLFVYAASMNPMPGVSDLFYRFDPLVALTAALAGRAFIAGLAFSGITLLLTLIFGRGWCGWICPMGTTLDLLSPRRKGRKMPKPPSERWRIVKYVLLVFILVAALFGNQTLIILDPITMLLARWQMPFGLPFGQRHLQLKPSSTSLISCGDR